ncbi:MAG: peroxide stress protein YaaA [Candidatus Marinimicrobia bacterium]|nr:peroxide stress protein YaaA [Candidatus Neomarinimicrobiota bacterium]|tara:strand:+ start:3252 stop:4025 length:774 start_codon:yes stop_codon:yes gene_type:complete
MITVLSPAKKLSKECFVEKNSDCLPQFLNDSSGLVRQLKKMTPPEFMSLMGISENLAELNWERMQEWNSSFNSNNSREAIYSFMGDTYTGLDADTLTKKDLDFAQNNTRILSGLYGLLRPLDLMKPYRLEMGTRFANPRGNNLYDYWNDLLVENINKELKNHKNNIVINCASLEYFKAIDRPLLNADIVTPQFKEMKNGKLKMISFFAKKARGMMARYIIQNHIESPRDILAFNLGGYNYDSSISTPNQPVFTRSQA